MRVIFAGTPDFAVPCLAALLESSAQVVAVYTQPDRPAGRGRRLQASPVKQLALEAGLPVFQPQSLKDEQAQQALSELNADLMVVVAYGLILPVPVLEAPKHGCWNIHASVLPRWRGAAPIQRALIAGDSETGVCLMQMERGLDTGPVLLEDRCAIAAQDNALDLHDRLSAMGAKLLTQAIEALERGVPMQAQRQPEQGVTYAHKLARSESLLDWSASATDLDRLIRGLTGWPVAEAEVGGERVKIHAAEVVAGDGPAGEILQAQRGQLVIACAEGALSLRRLQRPGGKAQSVTDYLNARQDLRR